MRIDKIVIQKDHLKLMHEMINADFPNESCGLVAGKGNETVNIFPITNTLKSPIRYQMDPEQQIRAILEIEENELDLLAIYHSHPTGPPVPSQTDIAEAMYPDSIYLIFSPGTKDWHCRGFKINSGKVREVEISIK